MSSLDKSARLSDCILKTLIAKFLKQIAYQLYDHKKYPRKEELNYKEPFSFHDRQEASNLKQFNESQTH